MVSVAVILVAGLALAISMILTRIIIPWVIRGSRNRGITTVDAHKPGKPEISEPGGLAPLLAFIFTLLIMVFAWEYISPELHPSPEIFEPLLAGLLCVVIAGLIGFMDDVFRISWRDKLLLGFLPAIPLMALEVGKSTLNLGIMGVIDFGKLVSLPVIGYINLYSLIFIPLAVNFAFNSFNMLAGFNGLEAGNGVISLATILIVALIIDQAVVTLFVAALLGGYLVLLCYNWYPAQTLIGDSGTLTLGTGIIVALVIGNMDRLAVGLFGLHFINFLLFIGYLYTRQKAKIATIDENGNIVAPCPYAVYWILPYFLKNIGEKKNVILLLLGHIIIVSVVLILSIPVYTP